MSWVVGCMLGFRTSGLTVEFYRNEIVNSATNCLLIEIAGVDDAKNDPHLDVTLYKGRRATACPVTSAREGLGLPATLDLLRRQRGRRHLGPLDQMDTGLI
jgi:hypothetical protein